MTKLVRIRIHDPQGQRDAEQGALTWTDSDGDTARLMAFREFAGPELGDGNESALLVALPGADRVAEEAIVCIETREQAEAIIAWLRGHFWGQATIFAEPGQSVGLREMAEAECVIGVMPDGTGRVLKNREGPEGHTISAKAVAWLRANPGGRLTEYAPPAPPGNGPA